MEEQRQAWFIAAALGLAAVVAVVVAFVTSSASSSVKPAGKATSKVSVSPSVSAASPEPSASDTSGQSPSSVAPTPNAGLPAVVRHIDTTDPVVFITIDDGYLHDHALITLMKQRHMPITVFLVNAAVHNDWSYFEALQQVGATIQDHTLTHPFLSRHPRGDQEHQICGAADIYAPHIGYRPWMFRPPYGDFNTVTQVAAQQCGMKYVALWNASLPHAVLRGGSGASGGGLAGAGKLAAGDIVLVHFRKDFVRDISTLLDKIDSWGLHVGKLEDHLPAA